MTASGRSRTSRTLPADLAEEGPRSGQTRGVSSVHCCSTWLLYSLSQISNYVSDQWGYGDSNSQTSCMPSKIPWVHWPAASPAESTAAAVTAPAAACSGQNSSADCTNAASASQPQRTAAVTSIPHAIQGGPVTLAADRWRPDRRSNDGQTIFRPPQAGTGMTS